MSLKHILLAFPKNNHPRFRATGANPNGSDYNTAMLASADGRHLVTMPHFERSMFKWNWANYPSDRKGDDISPWVEAFLGARGGWRGGDDANSLTCNCNLDVPDVVFII